MARDLLQIRLPGCHKSLFQSRNVDSYLSIHEVDESGRAQIVVLTKQPEWPLAERFYPTKEEAAGVRFYKDDAGRQWLQSLRISPRMAYWIMLRTDFNVFPCLKANFQLWNLKRF
ncbi:MAG: hypothetical protein R3B54_07005 [Bdellovibrionota bacterium]